ncbi:MAG: hypothetical protein M1823_000405 [Watsoniomyces obsoletus]|nr:MAG: hypothetical protein M1823_000405 [Watsoniomyces obsoletus]
MDKKFALATLECNVCGQNWQTSINYLSEPVDVYAEWVDASEALKKDSNPPALALPAPRPARETGQQPPARIRSADDADLDDWGGDNA